MAGRGEAADRPPLLLFLLSRVSLIDRSLGYEFAIVKRSVPQGELAGSLLASPE
jgi:hypothetical protein